MKVQGNFFSKEEVENLHEMTMEVMEKDGVIMDDDEACGILAKHGCKVDGHTVYFDRKIVEDTIKNAPSEFKIRGRNDKSVTLGKGHKVFAPGSGTLYVHRGNDRHANTAQDYLNFQKMDHTSKIMSMLNPNLLEPGDIDQSIVRDYQMAVCLKFTDKPLMGLTTSVKDCEHSINMIRRFYGAGEDETVTFGLINPMSPLKHNSPMLQACKYFAERNQATMFPCCSQQGITSPVTLSGTVVVNNAEILSGITYAQMVRPGAPVVYANTSTGTDMRFVTPTIGSPETALISFATAALADYYNIPCRTGGSLSDAKLVDWQAASESIMTMLAPLMSTASFILHSCGVMDSFMGLSYEKYLLDEQNIEMLLKIVNGMKIRTDAEELENIHEVGPGGQFIAEEHTVEYMHEELYTPALFAKMDYNNWKLKDGRDTAHHASDMIERRIAGYEMPPITREQEKVLKDYIGDLYDTIQ